MTTLPRSWLGELLHAASRIYFSLLFLWFLLYNLFGDGMGYLALANAVAVYFFLPLPIVLLFALGSRNWRLLAAGLLAAGVFAWLWGPLFWRPAPLPPQAQQPGLRVMTFNVLGRVSDMENVLGAILAEDADVLFLQEVTPEAAAGLRQALNAAWPYSVIEPGQVANGAAVFSRYPLERIDVVLEGRWRGTPQLLRLDWNGQPVTLVNFHSLTTGALWPRLVRFTTHERLEAMQHLAAFVAAQPGPVIVAGDANATQLNQPYKVLTAVLQDAWWQAGRGLGHTFPGPVRSGDLFTWVSLFIIPNWLVRIDYIFHTPDFQAQRAWLAEFHGGSDHRGVVADLVLVVASAH